MRTAFNLLGPLTNPGGRRAPARRRAAARADRARRAIAGAARDRARLGRARRRRPRRDLDDRLHEGVGVPRRRRQHLLRASGRLRPAKAAPEALRGGDAAENAASRATSWPAQRGAARDIVLLNAGASLLIAGAAERRRGRASACAAAALDSGRGRRDARAQLTELSTRHRRQRHDATATPDLLATIVAATRRIVGGRGAHDPARRAGATGRSRRRDGRGVSTTRCARRRRRSVIAECKRRSPSRGILRQDYDPAACAAPMQAPAPRRSRC